MWAERGAEHLEISRRDPDVLANLRWTVEKDAALLDAIDHDGSFHAPYLNRSWIEAWIEHQGGHAAAGFRLAVGWRGHRPVVAAPFQISRIGRLRIARIAAAEFSDYCAPAIDKSFRAEMPAGGLTAVWIEASRMLKGVDAVCLRKLIDDPRNMNRTGATGYVAVEPEGGHFTELGDSWENIGDRYFPKSTRVKLARKQRALASNGPVVCREAADAWERLALLEQMFRWKAQQLAHLGATNPFEHGPLTGFLRAFAQKATPEECRVFVLEAGDKPLAVTVLCCTGQVWGQYQTAYCEGPEAKHSPGQILQQHIMRDAAQSGALIYDFGYGDEEYKQRYCERHVALYREDRAISFAGRAFVAATHAAAQAIMFVKKDKRLRPMALAASQFLARFRPQRRSRTAHALTS